MIQGHKHTVICVFCGEGHDLPNREAIPTEVDIHRRKHLIKENKQIHSVTFVFDPTDDTGQLDSAFMKWRHGLGENQGT